MSEQNFQLSIPGMTCGGCASSVKKTLCSLPGVDSAVTNLSDHTVSVTGDVSVEELINAIKAAGYTSSELNLATE